MRQAALQRDEAGVIHPGRQRSKQWPAHRSSHHVEADTVVPAGIQPLPSRTHRRGIEPLAFERDLMQDRKGGLMHQCPYHGRLSGYISPLSLACEVAMIMGDQRAHCDLSPGVEGGLGIANAHGGTIGVAPDAYTATHGHNDEVHGLVMRIMSGMTEWRDRHQDEAGMALRQGVVA